MSVVTLIHRSAAQSAPALLACAALVAGFQVLFVGAAATAETSQAFGRIAELIPAFVQGGFSRGALRVASFQGLALFGFFHPVLMHIVLLAAVYVATEPAYDVESGRVDLLLARAVPRRHVITRSLVTSAGVVVLLVAAMALGTWIGLLAFGAPGPPPSARLIGTFVVHLVALGWCLGALGLAAGAGARRWAHAFIAVAVAAVALQYLDLAALLWPAMERLSWLSPFAYYPGTMILAGTAPPWRNLLVLWTATAVLWGIAYWRFARRDL